MQSEKEFIIYSNKYSLHERKTKLNGTVYDVHFRVQDKDGKTIQKKLSGFKTKTEAKQRYNRFVQDHCEFIYDKPKKKAEETDNSITVAEAFLMYKTWMKANCKPSTVYEREKVYDKFVAPHFAKCKLNKLTKEELSIWQDTISTTTKDSGEYFAYEYQRKIKASFSAFLEWCAERYGTVNYLSKIKPPRRRTPKKEMEVWTREDFQRFIDVVDSQSYRAFFTVLFFTGRRFGEVVALTPKDINLDKGIIAFTKSITRKTSSDGASYEVVSTKANKEQILPVAQPVIDALREYETESPFVFGGDAPLAPTTVRRYFNKYIEAAGVKKIRIHDLRHSFVSMLIHYGVNLTVVADLIGDTLEQVTKTYAHMYTEDRLQAVMLLK